jgi:hypothetical protein
MIYSYLYSLKELPFQVDQKMGSRPAVSRYSGVALAVVKQYFERLADGRIWMPDGSVRVHWADPELGLKAFWRDVLLATGNVRRRQVVVTPPGEGLQ